MVQTGLLNNIIASAARIDRGRRGLRTDGEEREGRISFEEGIAIALSSFLQAASTADPKTILLAEEAFVEKELRFCSENDTNAISSLTQALQSFEDAFLCLETVESADKYKAADSTYPHNPKCRIQGNPKDAFHFAVNAHRTRLNNVTRAPGINMIEKALLEQRATNMTVAQTGYIEKQKKALL